MLNALKERIRGRVNAGLNRLGNTSVGQEAAKQVDQDLLSKAVVLNSDDDALNQEIMTLLLRTIFEEQPQFVPFFMSELVGKAHTPRQAEQAIEKLILAALAENKADADLMAAEFFKHKARTKKNERAYVPAGRPNPNALFWPNPTASEHARSIHDELPYVKNIPLINKNTAITSMGSCFAVEISYWLQENGYRYVAKEGNKAADGSWWIKGHEEEKKVSSSAAWGILFNCPSFLQVVEKAFGYRRPAKILWTNSHEGVTRYCDPFREEIEFNSIQAFEANYETHIAAARSVLMEADVLLMTLGLNEVWYFKFDGSVFSRSPWRTAPSLVEHRLLSVEENVQSLQRMLDILRENNPNIKVIVTLSPVPLHATFLADDKHIIDANCHSKSVLRVAAEEFVQRNEGVYYFPSYELVTNCIKDPWDADQRHVTRETVGKVMNLFKAMYCSE